MSFARREERKTHCLAPLRGLSTICDWDQRTRRNAERKVRTLDERVVGVECSQVVPLLRRELASFEFSPHAVAIVEEENILDRDE